jgi:lipid-A-disaccharide synthase-like uncharacterized protein
MPLWIEQHLHLWLVIGLAGQTLFMMRFVVQWIASEKAGRSTVPELFWYFSLGGGFVLMIYAIHQNDPVFIIGQMSGLVIYVRNLWFIWRDKLRVHHTSFEDDCDAAEQLLAQLKTHPTPKHEKAVRDALRLLKSA